MDHQPFIMMQRHPYGGNERYSDQKSPNLDADGAVHFTEFDGEVLGPIPIRGASWTKELMSLDGFTIRVQKETEWRIFGISLYLTQSRLVLAVDKPVDATSRMAGQLRYPWVNSVGFRPRQSFLYDCELIVCIEQEVDGPEELPVAFTLKLLMDQQDDSGHLAQQIVQRIAQHHLDRGLLPESAVPGFKELLDPPRLPDPPKGDHAVYPMGACKYYPYGTEYVVGSPEQGAWFGRDVKG